MDKAQIDVVIEALNQIDRFLTQDIIQIVSSTTELEPQRGFNELIDNVEVLRSIGFHYTESQKTELEGLIANLQTGVNAFVDELRSAVERKRVSPDFDEAAALKSVNTELAKVQGVFQQDARGFKDALSKPIPSSHPIAARSTFICYRRADSHWIVDRIYRHMIEQFENVFRDIDSIPLGVPFPEVIRDALRDTDSVLVIIGPKWLEQLTDGHARLFNSGDHVRIEIETALELGKKVVPVLLSPAQMPTEDQLPESIRLLAEINGITLRPDPDFDIDMKRLMDRLSSFVGTDC